MKRSAFYCLCAGRGVRKSKVEEAIVKPSSLICWCLIVCVPLSAQPQSQAVQPTEVKETRLLEGERLAKTRSEVQKRGTGEQARVKVSLRDQTDLKGYISQ